MRKFYSFNSKHEKQEKTTNLENWFIRIPEKLGNFIAFKSIFLVSLNDVFFSFTIMNELNGKFEDGKSTFVKN